MTRLSLVALLAGCSGSDAPEEGAMTPLNHDLPLSPPGPLVPSDPPVITYPDPAPFRAACLPTENALRYVCEVSVTPAQRVAVTVVRKEHPDTGRTHTSPVDALDHTVGLYFLTQETTYEWTARAEDPALGTVSGTFVTGGLPPGADGTFSLLEGTSTSPMIGMVSPCSEGAVAVIMDPKDNAVLWYQDFSSAPIGFIDGVTFTEEGTVLAIADSILFEVDLMGNTILELHPGVDLPNRVHHDVFRKDGLTYVLFQELVLLDSGDYLLDGFYVLDGAGAMLGEWHLIDHFVPEGGDVVSPFAQDYSHANAIWVDDDRNVLISFRHLSAVAMVTGDTASPDFGTIHWRLANPDSEFGNDFALTSMVGPPANFEQQHNVHFLPDGSLMMLDNRIGYTDPTRVLQLEVDPVTAEAEIQRQFVLPQHCDFQGGALLTPAGNVLATCAPSRDGFEFDDLTGLVSWHGHATCGLGFGGYIPRFVPLDW